MATPKTDQAAVFAYALVRQVAAERIVATEAVRRVQNECSVDPRTANGLIYNGLAMLSGKEYRTKFTKGTTDYYLEMILRDYGIASLTAAISAVEKHLEYYENLPKGAPQPGIREIVSRYRSVAETPSRGTSVQGAIGEHKQATLRADGAGALGLAESEGYRPGESDTRPTVERQIRERRGQQQFRDALRARYGDRCMATECSVLAVLEAAHINPYRGDDDNHPENGLLLRSDIHTLFDLDLLGIEPGTLRVQLHPDVLAEYGHLAGNTLHCQGGNQPSLAALEKRYAQFQERLIRPQ